MQPQQQLTDDVISINAVSQQANIAVLKSGVTESHAKKRGFGAAGVKVAKQLSQKIDWLATFNHNKAVKPINSLRHKKAKTGRAVLHLVLLDTSASTLKNQLFAKAKAVILGIAEQAYLDREQLMLMGFGNGDIETLLPKKRAPKALKQLLDSIPAAGGTPLREVLQQAYQYQQQQLQKNPALELQTYLITDGKTIQQVSDITLLGKVLVIDIEDSSVKRGKAQQIAEALAADYFLLPV
jgi:magnesium chelatase subunit D